MEFAKHCGDTLGIQHQPEVPMAASWHPLLDPALEALRREGGLPLAKALNARGRHHEAAEVLDRRLAEQRSDFDAWFERLLALGDSLSEETALELMSQLEALRDEHPEQAAIFRNLGHLKLLMWDMDGAERALRHALKLDGHDARTLELMGVHELNCDRPTEAKGWILKALSLQPKDPRTLRLLSLALDQLEDHASAEAQLVAALGADPNYFWGWHTLGEHLMRQGHYRDGLRCIHKARSLNSTEPSSHFILAEIMAEQGHLDIAQGELHSLMLTAPDASILSEAQCLLGEYRRDMGDVEGAVSYLTLASETDSDNPNPWVALGDMAREEERAEDALRCYREALARDPEAADIQVQMGYAFLATDQLEGAEQVFLKALENDPSEYSAYLGLSECYRHAGRTDDQCSMVKEAMTLAPEDPDVWNAQGVAHELSDRLPEATSAYEKAMELDPGHRKAANNLGFVLEKRMERGEADLRPRAVEAWKRRLLICRDESQSLKKSTEHLKKLGISEEQILHWLNHETAPTL